MQSCCQSSHPAGEPDEGAAEYMFRLSDIIWKNIHLKLSLYAILILQQMLVFLCVLGNGDQEKKMHLIENKCWISSERLKLLVNVECSPVLREWSLM